MASVCRGCGQSIQWGFCDGRWVPLEPTTTHDDLDRRYVDEDGELRADHRDCCPANGETSVTVTRLARRVRAEEANSPGTRHRPPMSPATEGEGHEDY